jgi:hypothetical protein
MSRIPLLWFGDGGYPWGRNWILELLPPDSVDITVFEPKETPDVVENCIVCANAGAGNAYIQKLSAHGGKFGVILLSDECLLEDTPYIDEPGCVFVARNYAHPKILNHPKAFIFGLGWQNMYETYASSAKKASERRFKWGFAGSLKTDRAIALQKLDCLEPYEIYVFEKFNDPAYLTPKRYADLLNDCVFVPAPCGGASNDSFRIYEALQAGAIPIVLKNDTSLRIDPSYWHAVFRGESALPFVVADTWEQAALQAKVVLESGMVDLVQESCISFWQHWKNNWKRMFAAAVDQLKDHSSVE